MITICSPQAFGVFGLCQIHAFVDYVRSRMPQDHFQLLFKTVVLIAAVGVSTVGGILTFTGKISPWTGRFYSLLDPSYAKNNIPIIASVSEHQPTTWSSFYFDLQLLVFMFPVGLYYCFYKLTDANIFIIMYGVTSIYFAVSEILQSSTKCLGHLFHIVDLMSILHQAIFPGTCLAILLRHKLHVARQVAGMVLHYAMTEKFVAALRDALPKVGLISTNCGGSKNVGQLVLQQRCKTSCRRNCLV